MLFIVTTSTKNDKPELHGGEYCYHKFIIWADDLKEVKTKFKASKSKHKILNIFSKNSTIIEL